jgi:D-3-phosphoglycerate dehydrogenase
LSETRHCGLRGPPGAIGRSRQALSYKVLITGPLVVPAALRLFEACGVEPIAMASVGPASEIAELVRRHVVDALLVRLGTVDETAIAASAKLKVIAYNGVGYDCIDVAAATRRAIPVFISKGANARSVGEHALAMILALVKQFPALEPGLRAGQWRPIAFKTMELTGKRLALFGFGATARELYALAAPFRMRVRAFDPHVPADQFPPDVERAASLEHLVSDADVISLHAPLTDTTRGAFDDALIRKIKPGAVLVNVARGAIVDEAALALALREGRLGGVGADCFAVEPAPPGNPLFDAPNTVLTPHLAGVTAECLERMSIMAAENICAVLTGKPFDPARLVNPGALAARNSAEPA